jgi:hypothetical protein
VFAQGLYLAERILGARLVLVEGVGSSHGMIYERLDDWLGHVSEHLRSDHPGRA